MASYPRGTGGTTEGLDRLAPAPEPAPRSFRLSAGERPDRAPCGCWMDPDEAEAIDRRLSSRDD